MLSRLHLASGLFQQWVWLILSTVIWQGILFGGLMKALPNYIPLILRYVHCYLVGKVCLSVFFYAARILGK